MKKIDEITFVSPSNYKRLEEAGLLSIEDIATLDSEDLAWKTGISKDELQTLRETAIEQIGIERDRKRKLLYIIGFVFLMLIATILVASILSRNLSSEIGQGTIETLTLPQTVSIDVLVEGEAYYSEAYDYYLAGDLKTAANRVDEAFGEGIDSANLRNIRGLLYMDGEHYEKAISEFEKALSFKKDHPEATLNIGLANLNLNRFDQAAKYLIDARAYQPRNTSVLDNLAYVLYRTNQPERSEKVLRDAISFNNNREYPHYLLGLILSQREDYESALVELQRAMDLSPNDRDVLEELTYANYKFSRYEEATALLDELVNLGFDSAWANNIRGNILKARDQNDRAEKAYLKSIKLDSSYQYPYANLGQVYRLRRDYEASLQKLNKAIKIDPEFAWAIREKGTLYQEQKDYLQANEQYRLLIKLDDQDANAHANLGWGYKKLEDHELAYLAYKKALEIDSEISWAIKEFVWLAVELGSKYSEIDVKEPDYDKAEDYYKSAIKYNPDYLWAHSNIARLYNIRNNYSQGLLHAKEAVRIKPEDGYSHGIMGDSLFGLGRYEAALQSYQYAVNAGEESEWVYNGMEMAGVYLTGDYVGLLSRIQNDYLKRFPESYTFLELQASTLRNLGRLEQALASINQSLSIRVYEGNLFEKVTILGKMALREKNAGNAFEDLVKQAFVLLDDGFVRFPEYVAFYGARGWILNEVTNDFSRAYDDFEKIYRIDPKITNLSNFIEASLLAEEFTSFFELTERLNENPELDSPAHRQNRLVIVYYRFIAFLIQGQEQQANQELQRLIREYANPEYKFVPSWNFSGVKVYVQNSTFSQAIKDNIKAIADILKQVPNKASIKRLDELSSQFTSEQW